jgi:hypothetical protein
MTGTYGRFCEFAAYSFLVAEMTNGEGAREAARACTRWLPADFPGIGAWTQWWTVEAAVLPSLQVLQDDMYGEGHRRMHARKVDEATGDRAQLRLRGASPGAYRHDGRGSRARCGPGPGARTSGPSGSRLSRAARPGRLADFPASYVRQMRATAIRAWTQWWTVEAAVRFSLSRCCPTTCTHAQEQSPNSAAARAEHDNTSEIKACAAGNARRT